MRKYLAVIYGNNAPSFGDSSKKVYDGLKEIEKLLEEL